MSVRQVELQCGRVLSQGKRHLEQEPSEVHFELCVHQSVHRSLPQVHIDSVQLFAGWDVPRDKAETLPHKELVPGQLPAVRHVLL